MLLEFYLDPETEEPHIFKHGVSEEEVEEVLSGEGIRWNTEDGKVVVVGKTDDGHFLQVVFVEPDTPDEPTFVITAYRPKKELIAAYRRRMRRKGK